MLIELTVFRTAVTQSIVSGNLCGPAATHTLAELPDELLQDTKGLRVQGNAPFRIGWGAKAAESQHKVSKCRGSHKEEAGRQHLLLLQIASLSVQQPCRCRIIYCYRRHCKTFFHFLFPKDWKNKNRGEIKRQSFLHKL